MGARSSKLVITPENAETPVNAATEAMTQLKSNGETVNCEMMPRVNVAVESNGDCQADTTAETLPVNGSIGETKEKKPNPINWIQKKISFKKIKTPKKSAVIEEEPANPVVEEYQPVIIEEKKKDETQSTLNTDDIQVQSEELPIVDQETAIPDTPEVEQAAEPVVEFNPSTEEVQNTVGEEQYVEEVEPKEDLKEVKQNGDSASHEEELAESASLDVDVGVSEKIADLGIDASESLLNGNGVYLNGGAVSVDES